VKRPYREAKELKSPLRIQEEKFKKNSHAQEEHIRRRIRSRKRSELLDFHIQGAA
jgi:hypothetical protein